MTCRSAKESPCGSRNIAAVLSRSTGGRRHGTVPSAAGGVMRLLDRIGPRYKTTLLLALFCLVLPLPLRAQSALAQPSPEIRALLEKGQTEETQGHREEAARLYAQALQAARDHTD